MGNKTSKPRAADEWISKINQVVEEEIFFSRGDPTTNASQPGLRDVSKLYGLRVQLLVGTLGNQALAMQLVWDRENNSFARQTLVPLTDSENLFDDLQQAAPVDHTGEIFEICPPEEGKLGFRLRLVSLVEYMPNIEGKFELPSDKALRGAAKDKISWFVPYGTPFWSPAPPTSDADTYLDIDGFTDFRFYQTGGEFERTVLAGSNVYDGYKLNKFTMLCGGRSLELDPTVGLIRLPESDFNNSVVTFALIPVGFDHFDTIAPRPWPLGANTGGTPNPGSFAQTMLSNTVVGYAACGNINTQTYVTAVMQNQCAATVKTGVTTALLCGRDEGWNYFRDECFALAAEVGPGTLREPLRTWCSAPITQVESGRGLPFRLPSTCAFRAFCSDPAVSVDDRTFANCPTTVSPPCNVAELRNSQEFASAACPCFDEDGMNMYFVRDGLRDFVDLTVSTLRRPECLYPDCFAGVIDAQPGVPIQINRSGYTIAAADSQACPSTCVQIADVLVVNSVVNGALQIQQSCCLDQNFETEITTNADPVTTEVRRVCNYPELPPDPDEETNPDVVLIVVLSVVGALAVAAGVALLVRRRAKAKT